jgi:hypothetical protein
VLSASGAPAPNGGVPQNGWARILGVIGIPGAIACYLTWWLTQSLGARVDRMIQLLEQIALALKVDAP